MTHHERDDRQALAAGETYLIHVLETSDPPGNPDHYRICLLYTSPSPRD